MRKGFKKVLALATTLTVVLGMSTVAMAASDDIVLDGAGDSNAALAKTIDAGTEGEYKYMGWAYVGDASSDYKYLQITYNGDATALEQLRLELVEPDGDPNGPGYIQKVIWFGENEAGSFVTTDGGLVPAPTDKDQTVTIDLEASGYDLSNGIRAFHIHATPGMGVVNITDARLIKGAADTNTDDTNNQGGSVSGNDSDNTDDTDDKDVAGSNTGSNDTTNTPNTGNGTTGGGSQAPATGSTTLPIAIALCGMLVAVISFVAAGKIKEN